MRPEPPGPEGPGEPETPAGGVDDSGSLARHTAVMSGGTALSRLTGLVRVIVTAAALGVTVSRLGDAYNTANTTPNILYDLVLGGILSAVVVPVFVEWFQLRGGADAWRSASAVMTVAFVFLTVIMLVGILLSGPIVHLYTIRASGPAIAQERELATFFLRIFMPQIVFYGLGAVATGLLNARRHFAVPMYAPILNNLTVIATMAIFWWWTRGSTPTPESLSGGQQALLAVGTTLGVVAMTIVLWPPLRRIGFRWHWIMDLRNEALRRIGRLAGWMFVYVATNQAGLLVIIILAAGGAAGSFTAYTNAYIFFQLPYAIFAVSVFTALLPAMSSRWTAADTPGFRRHLSEGIRFTALILVPASVGYVILATPIVRLLLQHGLVTSGDADLIGRTLALFAIGLFPFSAFQLLLRAFYATQDTRTPALINLAATALNTLVNVLLFRSLGVEGLALGQTIAYTFATLVAAGVLRRRLHGLDGRRVAVSLAKIAGAGVCTGAAAWAASAAIAAQLGTAAAGPQAAQVAGAVLAGGLAFVASSILLRIEELAMVRQLVLSRVKR